MTTMERCHILGRAVDCADADSALVRAGKSAARTLEDLIEDPDDLIGDWISTEEWAENEQMVEDFRAAYRARIEEKIAAR